MISENAIEKVNGLIDRYEKMIELDKILKETIENLETTSPRNILKERDICNQGLMNSCDICQVIDKIIETLPKECPADVPLNEYEDVLEKLYSLGLVIIRDSKP